MRQDPEETGSESRAVPESGMQPQRMRLRSRGHSFGHREANEWNPKGRGRSLRKIPAGPREKGRNLDRIGVGTEDGGGAQREVGGAQAEPGEDGRCRAHSFGRPAGLRSRTGPTGR